LIAFPERVEMLSEEEIDTTLAQGSLSGLSHLLGICRVEKLFVPMHYRDLLTLFIDESIDNVSSDLRNSHVEWTYQILQHLHQRGQYSVPSRMVKTR
jgi:hypothetical protein